MVVLWFFCFDAFSRPPPFWSVTWDLVVMSRAGLEVAMVCIGQLQCPTPLHNIYIDAAYPLTVNI